MSCKIISMNFPHLFNPITTIYHQVPCYFTIDSNKPNMLVIITKWCVFGL